MAQDGIRLTLAWDGGRIAAAGVDSGRPQAASLLVGRAPAAAVALAPRLFSLCGQAQGAAATLALAAAQGQGGTVSEATTRAVALEAIGEHLWRLLLDWPALAVPGAAENAAAVAAARETFRDWRRRLAAATDAAAAARLGAEIEAWLPTLALPDCPERAVDAATALLPWRSAAAWAAELAAELVAEWFAPGPEAPTADHAGCKHPGAAGVSAAPAFFDAAAVFAVRPTAAGEPAETGALARQAVEPEVAAQLAAGRRIAARLAARVADLRLLARALARPQLLAGWLDAASPAPGVGLARVETARGLLLHLTQVNAGCVDRYIIVAPTEWNFHPQGAFARELVGAAAADREVAALLARRLALSLDPCVGCEVAVKNA